ncbi:MAG: hypothetical protein A2808_02125 [Candidatus Moranbacteria bacterium RIFCSPHIGHO2_01_FULL_55_24]|nr:MAG: hypothetical protein A2808_02125 [Candidatus Moranbacteria bacterium RIFCSPHIGHO2_01_FULL_55_24]
MTRFQSVSGVAKMQDVGNYERERSAAYERRAQYHREEYLRDVDTTIDMLKERRSNGENVYAHIQATVGVVFKRFIDELAGCQNFYGIQDISFKLCKYVGLNMREFEKIHAAILAAWKRLDRPLPPKLQERLETLEDRQRHYLANRNRPRVSSAPLNKGSLQHVTPVTGKTAKARANGVAKRVAENRAARLAAQPPKGSSGSSGRPGAKDQKKK